jgi:hypothetical protein
MGRELLWITHLPGGEISFAELLNTSHQSESKETRICNDARKPWRRGVDE